LVIVVHDIPLGIIVRQAAPGTPFFENVTNHANRLFPGKIRNGVKTYLDEKEITLILESIKNPVPSGAKSNLTIMVIS
jgi:hypothetical protein